MLDLYGYGWIFLPFGIYIIIKEQYSDLFELLLIVIANIMLVLLIFDPWFGWIMHVGLTFLTGVQTCLILYAAKQSKYQYNDERSIKRNCIMREVILPIAMMGFWLVLRVHTMQNIDVQPGNFAQSIVIKNTDLPFSDLLLLLKGWNCTFLEFTIFPLVWLTLSLIAMIIANYIKNQETQMDHKYQEFLLKYKISIDVFSLTISTVYNAYYHIYAVDPWECLSYRNQPAILKQILHTIIYCGVPFATLVFFYMKKGVFILSDKLQERQLQRIKEIQMMQNPFVQEWQLQEDDKQKQRQKY